MSRNNVPQEAQRSGRFQAEERTLGGYLIHPAARAKIESVVNAFDFEHPEHRFLFSALKSLRERGEAIEQSTVVRELVERGARERLTENVAGLERRCRNAGHPIEATTLDAARALRAASGE